MVKNIKYNQDLEESFDQLDKGAFLTTKHNGKVNTMTIAWGGITLVWHKKVFIVYVRYTRETYKMLEASVHFTISIPNYDTMKDEWMFCGTTSGKNVDKIKACNLKVLEGRQSDVPVLADCKTHYECKVIYKQAMEPANLDDEIRNRNYKNHDYHVIYYGEILDSYQTEGVK
jgi:flavin reductase (DIM6/NTAB) family NADH-FMN oxidoreductase RutF